MASVCVRLILYHDQRAIIPNHRERQNYWTASSFSPRNLWGSSFSQTMPAIPSISFAALLRRYVCLEESSVPADGHQRSGGHGLLGMPRLIGDRSCAKPRCRQLGGRGFPSSTSSATDGMHKACRHDRPVRSPARDYWIGWTPACVMQELVASRHALQKEFDAQFAEQEAKIQREREQTPRMSRSQVSMSLCRMV